jgi:hypothetical protein
MRERIIPMRDNFTGNGPEKKAPSLDLKTVEQYLLWLRSDGPWVLSAIDPDKPKSNPITRTFTTMETAVAWVQEYNIARRHNVHYTANPLKGAMDNKPSKNDVVGGAYAHVDADPEENETPEQYKARFLPILTAFNPRPAASSIAVMACKVCGSSTDNMMIGRQWRRSIVR